MAISLGSAGDFNVFVFGDMEHHHSDVEGALAVGGDLKLSDYALASQLEPGANHRDTLIVGGELDFSDGRIHHGNARSGGQAALTRVGFYDDDPHQTNGRYLPGNPLNFTQIESALQQHSQRWAGLAAFGNSDRTCFTSGCDLYLRGSDARLNIFSLPASWFTNAQGFYLDAPLTSIILINVDGLIAELSDFAFFRSVDGTYARIPDNDPNSAIRHDGSLTQGILFNFFEATTLDIHSIGVKGSVLAPLAATTFYNAHLDGQLVTSTLMGSPEPDKCADDTLADRHLYCDGQSNWYPFTALPEPSLLGWWLAFSVWMGWRHSKAPNR